LAAVFPPSSGPSQLSSRSRTGLVGSRDSDEFRTDPAAGRKISYGSVITVPIPVAGQPAHAQLSMKDRLMVTCPKCQFANPDGAETCGRCGHVRFVVEPAVDAAASEGDVSVTLDGGLLDRPLIAPGAVMSAPLPPPLFGPILAPSTPRPDSTSLPSHPAITVPPRRTPDSAATAPAEPSRGPVTPAPATVHELPVSLPSGGGPATVRNRPAGSTFAAASAPSSDPEVVTPPASDPTPPVTRVKLIVLRGLRIGTEYPIYEGRNTVGRFIDKPVDIDLIAQESVEQTWCSRTHAAFTFDRGMVLVEDLNSLNGTWVNGVRIHPGQPRVLKPNDLIQVGTVQMRLVVG
jgi:hypothetical protein